ncbi:MAG: zinc ribbon domain-containing protein [Candidatus Omnitrophica bacterium]|nr:zinc ribbon domain-containing protein [Candidatus Omnitrophota bacterium]
MPTYEYECAGCLHHFEALQPITAPPLRKCPRCGTKKARRLIGAGAGLIFKGSGFYITDYRTPSEKKARAEPDKKPAPDKKPTPPSKPAGGRGTSSSTSPGHAAPS